MSPYRRVLTTTSIDASWNQGRGAFGGLMAALLLEAMRERVADELRIARSLTVHFAAPAISPITINADVVRSGNRVTHATAKVEGDDGVVATFATASFCKPREGTHYANAAMPDVERAENLHDFPRGVAGVPTFFDHLDARFCGDVMPFSGSDKPRVAAWVRLHESDADDVIDAPLAAFLLDTLPPAVGSTFVGPRPLASVDLTVHFFDRFEERVPASEFHLVSVASRWADDGYAEELRELWSPSGKLLAQCRELIALL